MPDQKPGQSYQDSMERATGSQMSATHIVMSNEVNG